jgi:hypothetical protein
MTRVRITKESLHSEERKRGRALETKKERQNYLKVSQTEKLKGNRLN